MTLAMNVRAAIAAIAVATPAGALAEVGTEAKRTPPAAAPAAEGATPAEPDAAPTGPGKRPRKPLPPYVPGPPDEVAIAAAQDANLDPAGRRDGLTFVAAFGSAYQRGAGLANGGDGEPPSTDGGTGLVSFRFGHVASRDSIVFVEVAGRVFPYKNAAGDLFVNNQGLLGVGGQTYLAPAVWVRAGVALAAFTEREALGGTTHTRFDLGVGAIGGAGVDILRRHSFALALEVMVDAALQFPGVVVGGGFAISLGTY